MHPNVHSSTIYSNQDIEATQVPINKRLEIFEKMVEE